MPQYNAQQSALLYNEQVQGVLIADYDSVSVEEQPARNITSTSITLKGAGDHATPWPAGQTNYFGHYSSVETLCLGETLDAQAHVPGMEQLITTGYRRAVAASTVNPRHWDSDYGMQNFGPSYDSFPPSPGVMGLSDDGDCRGMTAFYDTEAEQDMNFYNEQLQLSVDAVFHPHQIFPYPNASSELPSPSSNSGKSSSPATTASTATLSPTPSNGLDDRLPRRAPCTSFGCLKTFTRESDKQRHLQASCKHAPKTVKMHCQTCGHNFGRYDSLKRHAKKQHGEDLPNQPIGRKKAGRQI